MKAPIDNLEKLAQLLDNKFELFGFRFGINFLIDLIPGIGDIASTAIAFYIFSEALKYKISGLAIFRMLLNIAFFFLVSIIPLIGDVIGAWYKPNLRNLRILQKQVAKQNR